MEVKELIKHAKCYRLSLEKSVGAVIYRHGPSGLQFLLLHYPHGHWDFVKGHVEGNETEETTLRREIREEVGMENVEVLPRFRTNIFFCYRAKGTEIEKRIRRGNGLFVCKRVVYYAVRVEEAAVKLSDEHVDWAWLDYEQALRQITHANSKEVIQSANKKIQESSV